MADLTINNVTKGAVITNLIIKDTTETIVDHTTSSSLIGKNCEMPLGVGFVQAQSGRYLLSGGRVIVVAPDGTVANIEFTTWLWCKSAVTRDKFLNYTFADDLFKNLLEHVIVGADLDGDKLPKVGLTSGGPAYNEGFINWQQLAGYVNFRELVARSGQTHYVAPMSVKQLAYIAKIITDESLVEATDFYLWSGYIPESAYVVTP